MSFVAVVAGARPNFMKVAPLLREFEKRGIPAKLIHTGQHYDKDMSEVFFRELGIREPDVNLNVGSGSHAVQTAATMIAYERFCIEEKPSWTLVVGDVNSTVACSLAAAKLEIKVCPLEAGLRSRDWSMPEEINRVVTDRLSDLLLTPSPDADDNLVNEGVPKERIKLVDNIMIDSLFHRLPVAEKSVIHSKLGVIKGQYVLTTLHRPSNVDQEEVLEKLLKALLDVAFELSLVLPLHPRTKKKIEEYKLQGLLESSGVCTTAPLGYVDFLALSSNAALVITDSGGLQEETTALGIPCLTVGENTERPITVSEGNQCGGWN